MECESEEGSPDVNLDNDPSDFSEYDVDLHSVLPTKVINKLETDLIRILFGKSAAEEYISIREGQSYDGNQNTELNETTTAFEQLYQVTSIEELTGTIDQISVKKDGSNQKNAEIPSFCEMCCGSRKVKVNQNSGPTSNYSHLNSSGELLPPQSSENKGRITLILDLDETLVHSSFIAIPHSDFSFFMNVDVNKLDVHVCIRPGAENFIKTLAQYYELVVFTASCQNYADQIINYIDPEKLIKYRLYRESCTSFSGCFVKDLSKIGRDLQRVIIIDNSPSAYMLQPYNAIAITDWIDDNEDRELDTIMDFLIKNHKISSVYEILVQ